MNVPDTEVRLELVKSSYLIEGYIPTIRDVYLENGFIRETEKYERLVQRVFATDWFRSSGRKMSSFVIVSSNGEKVGGLWAA